MASLPMAAAATSSSSFRLPSTHPLNSTSKPLPSLSPCHRRRLLVNTSPPFSSSRIIPNNKTNRRVVVARSSLNFPLISPGDNWGTWTALFATGAFSLWSERTKIGSLISAALVSIILGLAGSNLGIIPHEATAYSVVMDFLLPLTIPLMLFRADMRDVFKSTGTLLLVYLMGSVATAVGTLVAFLIVPMKSLGQDSWKVASALMASYTGGAINYVAVSDALAVTPSVMAAGVAADNVICVIYFMVLFALASKLPAESSAASKATTQNLNTGSGDNLPVLQTATALAVSFAICKCATHVVRLLKIQGGTLPAVTAIVVILATLLPKKIGYLAPAGDAVAAILIQVFFVVLGASGSVWKVMNVAPSIFVFASIQLTVHLVLLLGLGKLLKLDRKLLLLASNASIGGPTTASGMATSKGWDSLVVPGILVGTFGMSIATYIASFFGIFVLKRM